MRELLAVSEDHFYDLRSQYDLDYFLEYTDVDQERVEEILNSLAEWGIIDKELYEKKIIWDQQFVDDIADVYRKRKRETPNKWLICDRLNIKLEQSAPEMPQSKVEYSIVNEMKEEDSSKPVHPLQVFILKYFPVVGKIDTQLTYENCQELLEKFPRDFIVEKLESMENRNGIEKKYTSVNITLKKWCQDDLKEYVAKNRKLPKYKPYNDSDYNKAFKEFATIAKNRGIKMPTFSST